MKIKALYFYSFLSCSAIFEHDKYIQPRPQRIAKKRFLKLLWGGAYDNQMRIFVLKASMITKRKR